MTTTHESTDTTPTAGTAGRTEREPRAGRGGAERIMHLDSGPIDTTIELLEAAGLGPRLVCDGSCGGVSGCSLAPLDDGAIAA